MNEIQSVDVVDVDAGAFGFHLVMSRVFQDMMKRAEQDDEGEGANAAAAATALQSTVAGLMAQGVTGFGL